MMAGRRAPLGSCAEQPGAEQRGHRRVAAEADHRGCVQAGQDAARLDDAGADRSQPAHPAGDAAPGDAGAGQHVLRAPGEHAGLALAAAPVGHQHQAVTACQQFGPERLGREEMAAGASGGDHDRTAHDRIAEDWPAEDSAAKDWAAGDCRPCGRAM